MDFIISAVMFRGRASLGNATIRAAWHWALLTVQKRGARDFKGMKAGTGKGQKQLRRSKRMPPTVHFHLNLCGDSGRNESVPLSVESVNGMPEASEAAFSKAWGSLGAEVIGLFVQLSRIIGLPRSYAELYGLLFLSPKPLTMDEMIARLGISKGSASQGLNFLRKTGAIRPVPQPNQRATHYEAVAELRHLAVGFLQDQILPQIEDSQDRLRLIAGMVAKLPARERAQASSKITMLQSWGKRTRQFLPMVVEMMKS